MNQDEINDMEWRNPANWSWRGPLGMYASGRDTRLLVPKAMPQMGWTFNFANPRATLALVAIAALPLLFALALHLLS